MTEHPLTRASVLPLLTMTFEQAAQVGSAGLWQVVHAARRALIRQRATAARRRPILVYVGGTLSERTCVELRSRWHVAIADIASAANAASVA